MRRARNGLTLLLAVALVVLAISLLACNREEPREEGGDIGTTTTDVPSVEVTSVSLGRAVGADNRITDETSTFRPTDTIYTSVETDGVAPSSTIVARWIFEDGQVIEETTRTIVPNGPEITEFHVSKPDGWPVGNYEVVILVDGEEVDRASFNVEAG